MVLNDEECPENLKFQSKCKFFYQNNSPPILCEEYGN
jgi:hypothetical protein